MSGRRFRDDDSVDAGRLDRFGITGEKRGRLIEQRVGRLGLDCRHDHDFGHIRQPSGQREGADHAAEHRPVEIRGAEFRAFQHLRRPCRSDLRNCECVDFVPVRNDPVRDRRIFVFGITDRRPEGFGFDRQVHEGYRRIARSRFRQCVDTAELQFPVPEHIDRFGPDQLHAGAGHDRHHIAARGREDRFDEFFHIQLHDKTPVVAGLLSFIL